MHNYHFQLPKLIKRVILCYTQSSNTHTCLHVHRIMVSTVYRNKFIVIIWILIKKLLVEKVYYEDIN